MTDPLYRVAMVENQYHGLGIGHNRANERPKWLFYADGPGGPGPHGVLMSPGDYFDTSDEVTKMIPLLERAFDAGIRKQRGDVIKALGIRGD